MPLASWATIRVLLTLSSLLNLQSHQVDYKQAFHQAMLGDPMYMRVPQGWHVETGMLKQHNDPTLNGMQHMN